MVIRNNIVNHLTHSGYDPDQRQVYSGDLSQRIVELVPTWEQARLFLRSDTPQMQPAITWVDTWLQSPEERRIDRAVDLANLSYIEDIINAAKNRQNLFRQETATAFPCQFSGVMQDGQHIVGNYHVTVPENFWQETKANIDDRVMLVYNLHGVGGIDKPMRVRRSTPSPDQPSSASSSTSSAQPRLSIVPRATRAHRWDPNWLDLLHDHLHQYWSIDPQRVHLQGFSMGGFGTLQWGMRHPDRFATLTAMACHLSPWRDDARLSEN